VTSVARPNFPTAPFRFDSVLSRQVGTDGAAGRQNV
jgi:hypothetical protein